MNLVRHGEAHWKKRSMIQIEVSYNLEEITWAKVNEMNYYCHLYPSGLLFQM